MGRDRSLGVNFSRRDPYLDGAKFDLAKFSVACLVYFSKKQPFEVVFYFVVKGEGA